MSSTSSSPAPSSVAPLPHEVQPRRPAFELLLFFRRLREQWRREHLGDAAAALAFYGMLALFPFLLFIVALAGPLVPPHRLDLLLGLLARAAPPR